MSLISMRDDLNCTENQRPPPVEVVFKEMSRAGFVLSTVIFLLASTTLLIYLDEVHFIRKLRHYPSVRRTRYFFLLGLYPVFSWTSVLGLFIPRASVLSQLVSICYLALCVYQFFELIVDYFGGKAKMFQTISDSAIIPLRSVPVGCVLCCVDSAKLTRKNFLRLKRLVLQMAILHPLLMFIGAVLSANGTYNPGKISFHSSYLYITSIAGISTALAVWGLVMLYRIAKVPLASYHITAKFFSTQVVLIMSNVQGCLFILLAGNNVIKCSAPLVTSTRGIELHHLLLIFEMFVVSVIARGYYRKIVDLPHCILRQQSDNDDQSGDDDLSDPDERDQLAHF